MHTAGSWYKVAVLVSVFLYISWLRGQKQEPRLVIWMCMIKSTIRIVGGSPRIHYKNYYHFRNKWGRWVLKDTVCSASLTSAGGDGVPVQQRVRSGSCLYCQLHHWFPLCSHTICSKMLAFGYVCTVNSFYHFVREKGNNIRVNNEKLKYWAVALRTHHLSITETIYEAQTWTNT